MKPDKNYSKIILRTLFLIFLTGITAFSAIILDRELSARMEKLKSDVMVFLEKQLQKKIRYESLSPSIFMYLEVRDLQIYKSLESEEELFGIKKLRIMYNIFDLLSKKDPVECVSEINISDTIFRFDSSDGSDDGSKTRILDQIADSKYKFKVTGSNVTIRIAATPYTVVLTNLFFEAAAKEKLFNFSMWRGKMLLDYKKDNANETSFSTNLKAKGTFDSRLTNADLLLTVSNTSSDLFTLSRQSFRLSYKNKLIDVVKVQDKIPLDFHLELDTVLRKIDLNFKTESFLPLASVHFEGKLAFLNEWIDSSFSSMGKLTYLIDNNSLDYAMNVEMRVNRNPVLPKGIDVKASCRGNQEQIFFKPLEVHTNNGSVYFEGDVVFSRYFPEGLLKIANVQVVPGRTISGDFSLDRNDSGLNINGKSLFMGDLGFYDISLDLRLDQRSIIYDFKASLDQNNPVKMIAFGGDFVFKPEFSLSLRGNCSGLSIAGPYKFLTPDTRYSEALDLLLRNYIVSFDFNFSTNLKKTIFECKQILVSDLNNPENKASIACNVTNNTFSLNILSIDWEKYHIAGSGNASFIEDGRVAFSSSITIEDIPYEIKGSYMPDSVFTISGTYDLAASLYFKKGEDSIFTAKATKFPLPVHSVFQKVFYTSFDLNGAIRQQGEWQITCPRLIIYDVPVFKPLGNTLETAFVAQKSGVLFSRIRYRDKISEVQGNGKIDFSDSDISEARMVLSGGKTGEKYQISINSFFKALDLSIDFENLPLERLGDFAISGSLTGKIGSTGNFYNPRTELNIALVKGAFNGDRLTFRTQGLIDKDALEISSFDISYLDHTLGNGLGRFDRKTGIFSFNARYKANIFKKTISSYIDLKGSRIDRPWGDDALDGFFKGNFISVLSVSAIKINNQDLNPWSLTFSKTADTMTFIGGPDKVVHGAVSTKDGSFNLAISAPFPIQAIAHGVLIDGKRIDSCFDSIRIDTSVLSFLTGDDILHFTQGSATGTNLCIKGLITDPDFTGTLTVQNAQFSYVLSPDITEPFNTTVEFKEKTISMAETEVSLGGGTIKTDYARFFIEHWIPVRYEMAFKSDDEVGLHTVYDFGAVSVDGYAIGSIKASGDQGLAKIDGDLDVSFCKITLGSNNVKPLNRNDKYYAGLILNLQLRTRKKVEFLWPSTNFPVLNCVAKPQCKLAISLSTESNTFAMKGIIDILRGEVFFFNRNFQLQQGNIVFNIKDPADFDPRISLRADIREVDANNENVDIYFIVENNKLSELNPRLESIPIKTESEIYALLGGSIQQNFDSDQIGVSMVLFSSEILSQFGFFLSFEEAIRKMFNLDLFSIRTQVLRNIIAQGMTPGEPQSSSSSLGKYLDDTTITFGRYIGDDLFVMGLVRLKEIVDPAQTALNNGFFGVEPEFEIALQWPTPFFNLEWSFAPKQEHLKDMFLPDTNIKFEWHYSY